MIATEGQRSDGILAQSIGGGGGDGGFSVGAAGSGEASLAASLGGSGGTGIRRQQRDGHELHEYHDRLSTRPPVIHRQRRQFQRHLAQSLGGGGGSGGFSIAGSASFGVGAAGSIGGKGGSGDDAGIVTVTNVGTIFTAGDQANGIEAQSIGGGGGNGGYSIAGKLDASTPARPCRSAAAGRRAVRAWRSPLPTSATWAPTATIRMRSLHSPSAAPVETVGSA